MHENIEGAGLKSDQPQYPPQKWHTLPLCPSKDTTPNRCGQDLCLALDDASVGLYLLPCLRQDSELYPLLHFSEISTFDN